jgi:hypothetical protein
MALPTLTEEYADTILEKIVSFEDGSKYERLKPMTNFRKDDRYVYLVKLHRSYVLVFVYVYVLALNLIIIDVVNSEARILYLCRLITEGSPEDERFVMKVKVQYVPPPPSISPQLTKNKSPLNPTQRSQNPHPRTQSGNHLRAPSPQHLCHQIPHRRSPPSNLEKYRSTLRGLVSGWVYSVYDHDVNAWRDVA